MRVETIVVLDYGAQYNQLICRRVRELGVYSELLPHDVSLEEIQKRNVKGIILSGSPFSVYDPRAPKLPEWLLKNHFPILGICYGMQLLTKSLGGKVSPAKKREYGHAKIKTLGRSTLFYEIKSGSACWMSHGDEIGKIPEGFRVTAESLNGKIIAGMENVKREIYGVQFHPEVTHTSFGTALLRNFLKACGCHFSWNLSSFTSEAIDSIRHKIGNGKAICGVSGGVDSTVAAILVSKAIGKNLHAVFVDNGLLRADERNEVKKIFSQFPLAFHVVDASDIFLKRLKGVVDPEQKRKIIGETFIRVFEKKAKSLTGIKYLVQGTLYPDVIESATEENKLASKIKTHHNVGGLPEKMGFHLIEPLRYLFKDEVRRIGKKLKIPSYMIDRQPFPGPGLAVRVLGDVNGENLALLRQADRIVREEIGRFDGCKELWQFFAVLLPLNTVGVMGDGRTYQKVVALRVVHSQDGMTADWARLPWELLGRISSRIVGEVRGVNRVVYDITSKPPATIEWE